MKFADIRKRDIYNYLDCTESPLPQTPRLLKLLDEATKNQTIMDDLYRPLACYGVGLSVATVIASMAALLTGSTHTLRKWTPVLLYSLGITDIVYGQIKVMQLNSHGLSCVLIESMSVLFYIGASVIQYMFLLARYIEVYGFHDNKKRVILALILNLAYTACIPVSMSMNRTTRNEATGECEVFHPPVSAYMPTAIGILTSAYMTGIFVGPLLGRRGSGHQRETITIGKILLITSILATFSAGAFNVTLATPLGRFASVLSMADLAFNYVMLSIPYFVARIRAAEKMRSMVSRSSEDFPRGQNDYNDLQTTDGELHESEYPKIPGPVYSSDSPAAKDIEITIASDCDPGVPVRENSNTTLLKCS
ncbi:uncharacterized protein VTP21DRAFT_7786 [Calcarisporiella thermophila]|uniref:uncharacterized protein n=1 Tax=Calcarisporiella thermophila TaxID=911321 RepID=UPI00374433C7